MQLMRKRSGVVTAMLMAGALVAVAAARSHDRQSSPQGQPPAQNPQIPVVPDQKPIYRMQVDLITTDVIVRDGRGQFVADLKKEDFEVLEDGVKQDVVSMTLAHGGRIYNLQAPPPPPPQEGILLPPPRPTNDAAGRIFILMIDDLHLDFRNTGRLRDLVKKVGQTLIHDGDLWAAVSTGPSSIAQDLTYDRRRIDEIVKRISGAGLKASEIIDGPESADGPSEVRYRAHVAFSTTYDYLRNLEQVRDRRKAIVYISEGYDFNPFAKTRSGEVDTVFQTAAQRMRSSSTQSSSDGSDTNSSATDATSEDPFAINRQGQQFADADLAHELAEVTRAANRANASFYTIDPRGLVGMPDIDENLDPSDWADYIRKSQDSLRVLAEQTGGIAVVNQNDFERALKRIDNETSDYYVLGYYTKNPDPTIRIRQLQVKVNRPDMNVYARRQYSLRRLPVEVKK